MENEYIERKTEWIRSIHPGETKTGYVREHEELDTLSTLLSRFNMGVGRDRGVFVTGKRNWFEKSFTLSCRKIEENNDDEQTNDQGE